MLSNMRVFVGVVGLVAGIYIVGAGAYCRGQWTRYYDYDGSSRKSDFETLEYLKKRYREICAYPTEIDKRVLRSPPRYAYGRRTRVPAKINHQIRFCCAHRVSAVPYCPGDQWTRYYDRDDPSGKGDYETLKELRQSYPEICAQPTEVDVRLLNGLLWDKGGNYIDSNHKSTTLGFVCINEYQKKYRKPPCKDYKIRFCCGPEVLVSAVPYCPGDQWTKYYDRDDPSGKGDYEMLNELRQSYPEICAHPTEVDVRLLNGLSWDKGGNYIDSNHKSSTLGFACINEYQKKYRKPPCKDYKIRFCCLPEVRDVPYCPGNQWTRYYDRDDPSGKGDYETLKELRQSYPEICAYPTEIDVRLLNGLSWEKGGNYIDLNDKSPLLGFACINEYQKKYQKPPCKDYRIRFCCLPEEPKCPGYWSPYYDRDNPSENGDYEDLSNMRKEYSKAPIQYGNPLCKYPVAAWAKLVDGRHYLAGGDKVDLSKNGLVCKNEKQVDHACHDYKVKFCCVFESPFCQGEWTEYFDRDDPTGDGDRETLKDIRKIYPNVCPKPSNVQGALFDGSPYQAAYENTYVSKEEGLICENKHQQDRKCHDYKVRFCCPKPLI